MSIIYDALKKAEQDKTGQDKPENKVKAPAAVRNKRNNLNLILLAAFAVVFICVVFITVSIGKKKEALRQAQAKKAEEARAAKLAAAKTQAAGGQNVSEFYVLEGIIYDKENPSAIINGKILKVKDKIDDFQIQDITPTSVKLINSKDNTTADLNL